MKEFNILLVGDFLSEKEITIALNSFGDFYHSVTSKHQRKTKLTIVESPSNFPVINKILEDIKISTACNLISPKNESAINNVLSSSSIMFLPTKTNISKLIPIALKNKLPIITISTTMTRELLDNTCSKMVEDSSDSILESNFSETLNMLYFDPEARQILARAAFNRYHKEYSWGNAGAVST